MTQSEAVLFLVAVHGFVVCEFLPDTDPWRRVPHHCLKPVDSDCKGDWQKETEPSFPCLLRQREADQHPQPTAGGHNGHTVERPEIRSALCVPGENSDLCGQGHEGKQPAGNHPRAPSLDSGSYPFPTHFMAHNVVIVQNGLFRIRHPGNRPTSAAGYPAYDSS